MLKRIKIYQDPPNWDCLYPIFVCLQYFFAYHCLFPYYLLQTLFREIIKNTIHVHVHLGKAYLLIHVSHYSSHECYAKSTPIFINWLINWLIILCIFPETLKYWVGVQWGKSYLMGRRCLFSLDWPPF